MKQKIGAKEIFMMAGFIVGCVCILTLVGILIFGGAKKDEDDSNVVANKGNTTISVDVLEENLQDMQTLISEKYDFTFVEKYKKAKKILFINADSEFSYSYDGSVTAGIDMSKVSVTVDDNYKRIIVSYPEATIQQIEIDYDSFKKYSEKEGLWNPLKINDYNEAQKEFTETAKERAIEKDIIGKANTNAAATIENFLKLAVGDEYTIVCEKQ